MKHKWTVEELELAVEAGRRFGDEVMVGDSLDVLGDYGAVAKVWFHFEGPDGEEEESSHEFTFNNCHTLEENFDELWESVQHSRALAPH